MSDATEDTVEKTQQPVRRLCNEIQLFDLCELEKCRYKDGLFCTDQELLNRFEAIAEVEERPVNRFDFDESDGDDEVGGEYDDDFDDGYDTDRFDEDA